MIEDANSILDVHDFNRVRSSYARSAIYGEASVCPTGGPEMKKPPGGPLLNFNNTLEPQNEFRNSTRSNLNFPGVFTRQTEMHEPEQSKHDLHAKFSSMLRHSHAFTAAATNTAQAHDDRTAR